MTKPTRWLTRPRQWFWCLFGIGVVILASQSVIAQDPIVADKTEIDSLIEQLGDADFTSREFAQSKLREMGLIAFDQLHEAQTHNDIEVAKRAKYLIRSLQVQWALRTDAPEVRRLLAKYEDNNPTGRRSLMEQLASLPEALSLIHI